MEDKTGINVDRTIEYYEKNAEAFVKSTFSVDMGDLYAPFEKYLFPKCKILDLGCGSGRDSKYFFEKGYIVTAIDPSVEMCAHTYKVTGITALQLRAEEIEFADAFDAVWACASLLHVKKSDMEQTIYRCIRALKCKGVMYASWKYGKNQRVSAGRHFSDYTEKNIEVLLQKCKILNCLKCGSQRTCGLKMKLSGPIL